MFNHQVLGNSFMGLAGLRPTDHPDFAQLPSTLLYNGTNVLIEHPLINIENLDMLARNYSKFAHPSWVAGTTYGIDTAQTPQRVTFSGTVYRSKVAANTGNAPDVSPDQWEPLNLLGLYLEDIFRTAGVDAAVETFNRKKIDVGARTIVSQVKAMPGVGNYLDTIINEGDLVGVEITLKGRSNIVAVIDRIGLQLTQPQELDLYLFHSSQLEPVATITVNHTKQTSFQWHVPSTAVEIGMYGDYDTGGSFFLVYDQDDLVGQAIRKRASFHLPPCRSCNMAEAVSAYNSYSQFATIRAIRVENRNSTNPLHLWDLTKMRYEADTNFGLNFEMTIRCDVTNYVVANKGAFAFAVRDMIIFKLLNMMANSTRINDAQSKVSGMARAELTAKYAGGMGFMETLDKQLKAVNFEFTGLDSACMPRGAHSGLKSGAFGLAR